MAGLPEFEHKTVLLDEAVALLAPRNHALYVDCTLGGAGHTERLLQQSGPEGRVLGLDQDPVALSNARQRVGAEAHRLVLVRSNFRNLRRIAVEYGFSPCAGILFDLGVSSPQFDEAERGFSYRFDAPLDMRMDPDQQTTAADLVNDLDETELARIFREYGEERFAGRIAAAIGRERRKRPLVGTGELAELVKQSIPAATRRTGSHPARRVFQALRIAVNDELGALAEALAATLDVLGVGGRVAIITFHSLEDRMVKQTFAQWARGCTCPPDFPVCRCGNVAKGKLVTRKPVLPSVTEVAANPRSRSAKLRAFEKA